MAMAAQALMDVGMESVERHETALTAYALDRLRSLPEITIYGEADPQRTQERVGVISFNLGSAHHALVAAILGYEAGIGVRNGCFCAQPYVSRLLGVPDLSGTDEAGDHPGMVRVSIGAYSSLSEIDVLLEALHRIGRGAHGAYARTPDGEYAPQG